MDALNVDGVITFLLAFAILFTSQLMFLRTLTRRVREAVRVLITTILLAGVAATLLSVWLAFSGRDSIATLNLPASFTIMAAFCQIASVAWLIRYRAEERSN